MIQNSHLRAVCRIAGEKHRAHSLATVVSVIQRAAPSAVAREETRLTPVQTRPALVTRPERLTLKSRQDTFSEHYWARRG